MPDTVATDITGKPFFEPRAWSFSAVDKFTNCPRQFKAYVIDKSVVEPESPQMKEGFRVHKAMAAYIEDGTPLPPDLTRYGPWKNTFVTGTPGEQVLVEQKFAFTAQLEPCEFFDRKKKVWCRTVADLVVINGSSAQSVDWKTGNEPDPKYQLLPPNFQLKLVAFTLFLKYPELQSIESSYVYLPIGKKVSFNMERREGREFYDTMSDVVAGLQHAVRTDSFPPRKSGLCKRHCGVLTCEYNGARS